MKYIKSLNEYFDSFAQPDYFISRDKCTQYGACLMPEWEESLTDVEKQAIDWYRDAGYRDANKFLNTGRFFEPRLGKETKENTDIILKSLERITLSDDITVYKGVIATTVKNRNPFFNQMINIGDNEIGNEIDFKGLMSTTLHYQYTINGFIVPFGNGGIIIKFILKKGDNAAYISLAHPEDGGRAENEILIHPSTKYIIDDIGMVDNNGKVYKLITLKSI